MARQPDLDELPHVESLNPTKRLGPYWYWDENHRNSKDSMLWRVFMKKLNAAVGRPWNDVYSELKPELPKRLENWLYNYVNIDGHPERLYWGLYVDKDGILKEHKKPKKRKRKSRLPPLLMYQKKAYTYWQGFWWVLNLKPFDDVKRQYSYLDRDGIRRIYYEQANDIFWGIVGRESAKKNWWTTEPFVCVGRNQVSGELSKKLDAYSRKKFHIGG